MAAFFHRICRRFLTAWQNRAVVLKAASFAMVGVVNTLVDLAVFLFGYGVLGLPLIPANVLSWLVAVTGSYVMNSYITFSVESGRQLRWRDYGTFVASGVAGVIANTTALVVAAKFLPVIAAKLVAILASFLVNFLLSHLVVFRPRGTSLSAHSRESRNPEPACSDSQAGHSRSPLARGQAED